MKINNNIPALNSYRQLNQNTQHLSKALENLSSGLRINRAADDAAGLTISQKMKTQIRGLQQAERNIMDGISLVQVADAGLNEIHSMLHRMRELSVQAANDTYNEFDRQQIQSEVTQLKQSIDDIANNTEFNGIKLLNGTAPNHTIYNGGGGQTAGNVLSNQPVGSDGRFQFATAEGYPTTSLDNNQRLVFGNGSTSYPAIRVNGQSFVLYDTNLASSTQEVNGTHQTVFQVNGVEITQSVRIVGPYQDKYEIKYDIKNVSGQPQNIGMLYHIDTMLGNDDFAPFIVNGQPVPNETVYTGANIPSEFIVYNQNTGSGGNAEFQAHGILKSMDGFTVIEEPSQFAIGRYNRVNNWNFVPSGPVGDSGYSVWWNERPVESGASFSVNTFFGQSVPPSVAPPTQREEGPFELILQVGPNQEETFKMELSDVRTEQLGIDELSVLSSAEATQALDRLDAAIAMVSTQRSKWGAYQNRLEHILSNASNYKENITSAESRITDADMALSMVEFTKRNILNQSATAMLAQSNQLPQGVLQLLR
ncbi:flagellin [Alkalihalobacterium chitinilyticum]|uniref:Flagellin n=1 Tax=Alkalihalobacterium chitinilyticum TaxID=2980103 RepID=A0ABT5VEZ8_9BACI|nr:flagellin [Alkalihalobacterium chitinilyticum]MDE5414036.1 flagellin [Alkalihalobacterium chitinilyticum]